jgi:prephenate dehydratase
VSERVAYLGPAGTHSHEALRASTERALSPEPRSTIRDAILAVQEGAVARAFVPIENSLEGGVAATLDTLAGEATDVRIVAEFEHPVHHHLVAGRRLALPDVARVLSHPHAAGQCATFLRERLPGAEVAAASSTAEAVRVVTETDEPWAALGSRLAADLYGGTVLAARTEDRSDNVTRFVWLAPATSAAGHVDRTRRGKTSIVFWGFNDESPGALVSVLRELSDREINLTKIESRPRRVRLGHYMFFADLEAQLAEPRVTEALEALRARVDTLRVLGSYPLARPPTT